MKADLQRQLNEEKTKRQQAEHKQFNQQQQAAQPRTIHTSPENLYKQSLRQQTTHALSHQQMLAGLNDIQYIPGQEDNYHPGEC